MLSTWQPGVYMSHFGSLSSNLRTTQHSIVNSTTDFVWVIKLFFRISSKDSNFRLIGYWRINISTVINWIAYNFTNASRSDSASDMVKMKHIFCCLWKPTLFSLNLAALDYINFDSKIRCNTKARILSLGTGHIFWLWMAQAAWRKAL